MSSKTNPPSPILDLLQDEIERLFQEYKVKKNVLDRERQDIIKDFAKRLDDYQRQKIKTLLKNQE